MMHLFFSAPDFGRILQFEVLSFEPLPVEILSPYCQMQVTAQESFYNFTGYTVPSLITYRDYLNLLEDIRLTLTRQGYNVTCLMSRPKELPPRELKDSKAPVSKFLLVTTTVSEQVSSFAEVADSTNPSALDETVTSVLQMPFIDQLKRQFYDYDDNS